MIRMIDRQAFGWGHEGLDTKLALAGSQRRHNARPDDRSDGGTMKYNGSGSSYFFKALLFVGAKEHLDKKEQLFIVMLRLEVDKDFVFLVVPGVLGENRPPQAAARCLQFATVSNSKSLGTQWTQ